jgi:lipopolysaccharide transport system permease protein
VKVRFKQTAIGAGWAMLQPALHVLIFILVFQYLTRVPSDGIPYPVFAYTGVLPWSYFAKATDRCGNSLVVNTRLITKVYFPRLIVPLAALGAPLVDFGFACLFLLSMMAWYEIVPTWGVLLLPLFLLLTMLSALATGLFVTALNVRYRDVSHLIPFALQVWMFLSPVAYPLSLVPERWRTLYSLNPMVGAIEGFRWALLGTGAPDFLTMTFTGVFVCAVFLSAVLYFRRMERTFADVI